MRHTGRRWATTFVIALCALGIAPAQELNNTINASTNIVQLRDEPARNPFQQSVANSTCEEAPNCQVAFSKVLPHTRLVITRFNAATYSTPTASNFVYSELSGASNGVVNTFLHIIPASGNSFVNEATLMFFEAGSIPIAKITNQGALINVRVTISGYLVHLP